MMRYLVKVGDGPQPAFRMETPGEVRLFLVGLLIGDGRGLERADATVEGVVDCFQGEGRFEDNLAFTLSGDARPVYVWSEDS